MSMCYIHYHSIVFVAFAGMKALLERKLLVEVENIKFDHSE